MPELHRIPPAEQDRALEAARETALDLPELLGMAVGLVAVTALTRYSLSDTGMSSRFGAAMLNFVVALPLLLALLGPLHLRRLRRGLREQLQRRQER